MSHTRRKFDPEFRVGEGTASTSIAVPFLFGVRGQDALLL